MNNARPQDLSAAFASIITMMLREIRARGWRGLKDLPEIWRGVLYMRQQEKALAELMAAFLAGKLPPAAPVPEPAPWTDPPEQEALCAQPSAPHCPAARPDPAARDRPRVAERPSVPVAEAGPDRTRELKSAGCAALSRPTRASAAEPRWPSRRALDPFAVFRRPTGIFATGRSP